MKEPERLPKLRVVIEERIARPPRGSTSRLSWFSCLFRASILLTANSVSLGAQLVYGFYVLKQFPPVPQTYILFGLALSVAVNTILYKNVLPLEKDESTSKATYFVNMLGSVLVGLYYVSALIVRRRVIRETRQPLL